LAHQNLERHVTHLGHIAREQLLDLAQRQRHELVRDLSRGHRSEALELAGLATEVAREVLLRLGVARGVHALEHRSERRFSHSFVRVAPGTSASTCFTGTIAPTVVYSTAPVRVRVDLSGYSFARGMNQSRVAFSGRQCTSRGERNT